MITASAPLLIAPGLRGPDTATPGTPAVLFVTDEIFLPHRNGSSQIYTQVARTYAQAGWRTHCLSFYRDPEEAQAPATLTAYRQAFDSVILAPGWNLGGTPAGKAGMAIREATRWLTGNVFASHPLLAARRQAFQQALLAAVRQQRITLIYFHKPHTMLLLEPMLRQLRPARFILDLHDDFVARSEHYTAAYGALFSALPWRDIVGQHRAMYLRHKLGRSDSDRSRRRELALLSQCEEVRTASEAEYATYAQYPALQGRVRREPWQVLPTTASHRVDALRPFHAGFIGADSVMNLDAVIHLRDNIMPLVRARLPDVRMLIAGTLSRKVGALLSGVPNIEVWGQVPDVTTFYDAIAVAAVPLRFGTGVSVKALEALGHGCPLVTTTTGVRGLDSLMRGQDRVDIADDPAGFAAALVRRATAPPFAADGARQSEHRKSENQVGSTPGLALTGE